MSVALGFLLGLGMMLIASPWLWPRRAAPAARRRRLHDWLARAGWDRVSPGAFVAVSAVAGVISAGAVLAVLTVPGVAAVAGVAAGFAPAGVVVSRTRRRARLLRGAWPDLVDHLVASIRAGQSLGDALAGLAAVGPPELRAPFRDFAREFAARGALVPELDALKERLADPVADRIIETIRMAREVGGTELPAVLRALAAGLRQDAAVRSEVEARQTWVANAARLGVAAPWIVLALLASRPEAAAAYNTAEGTTLLAAGFAVTVVAYRLMLALGRIPAERRWFA